MNLYEAIFVKKSVRKYVFDAVDQSVMERITDHYRHINSLFGGISSEIDILDSRKKQYMPVSLMGVKAPYYLIIYSDESPRYLMNAGYLMESMSLFLCTIGLGSCILGHTRVKKKLQTKNGLKIVGVIAFGKSKDSFIRKHSEAKRLPVDALCVFKEVPRQWMKQLLEAARMAPSSMNTQPWRFVVYDNAIHIFSKKPKRQDRLTEINFGAMFAHLVIAAEELWLDMDLIRLNNITQKHFTNNQYVLSAVINA